MNKAKLVNNILSKKSFLCVGLDSNVDRIPKCVQDEYPQLSFNKAIIEKTQDYAVAYKLNTAFYESQGVKGWESLAETLKHIPDNIFKIADAKRGDIGNTSFQYAKAFFEQMSFDAVTVTPYMGADSITPFLEFKDKWIIVLGVTSNKGSYDFQFQQLTSGMKLFEEVLKTASKWGTENNIMFVIGATHPAVFHKVRRYLPNHFLLVPGVGAQGGDLESIIQNAKTKEGGLLVNSSRSIIFADDSERFAEVAGQRASELHSIMMNYF